MKTILALLVGLVALPTHSHAQGDVQSFADGFLALANGFIFPFLVSLAVLVFVYSAVRYFILESADAEARETARSLMLYGILALVFIVAFWGIISFVMLGFGFSNRSALVPDFIAQEPLSPGDDDLLPPPGETTGDGLGSDDDDLLPPPGETTGDGLGSDDDDLLPPEEVTAQDVAETQVRDEAEDFFSDDLAGDFGADVAADLIDSGMFADLHQEGQGEFNDLERLQAAYRLRELGAIETSTLQDYLDATNDRRVTSELAPISVSDIASDIAAVNDIANPTSQESEQFKTFYEQRDTFEADVRDSLKAYSERPITKPLIEDEVEQIVAAVTDPSIPASQRRETLNALLVSNPDDSSVLSDIIEGYDPGAVYIDNDDVGFQFDDNVNIEHILKGKFQLVQ